MAAAISPSGIFIHDRTGRITAETTQKSTVSRPNFRRWVLCYDLVRIPVLQQGHDFLVIVHLVQHYRAPTLSPLWDRPLGVKAVRASRPEDGLGLGRN